MRNPRRRSTARLLKSGFRSAREAGTDLAAAVLMSVAQLQQASA
jgi:hypothetical protein